MRGSRIAPGNRPELVIRRKHPVVAVPALSRRHEIRQTLEREGWPGAIPQQVFQFPKRAEHIAVDEVHFVGSS